MNSTEYLLKLIPWQFFGTLTWRSDRKSVESRAKNVDEFLRKWAAREQQRYTTELPAFIRWERGAIGDRLHCHFLLTGFRNPKAVSLDRCFRQKAIWTRHRGLCRIRLFAPSCLDRVCSYLNGNESTVSQGNNYEMRKSHFSERHCFNAAAWSYMQRVAGVEPFEAAHTT